LKPEILILFSQKFRRLQVNLDFEPGPFVLRSWHAYSMGHKECSQSVTAAVPPFFLLSGHCAPELGQMDNLSIVFGLPRPLRWKRLSLGFVVVCMLGMCIARADVCVTAPSGLMGWWQAEGNANNTVDGNSGVLMNGAVFATGKVGQAFAFDGTSSYVRIADSPNLRFTNALTIEAWIYPTSLGAAHNIVSK
jgi:hypothetical protein